MNGLRPEWEPVGAVVSGGDIDLRTFAELVNAVGPSEG